MVNIAPARVATPAPPAPPPPRPESSDARRWLIGLTVVGMACGSVGFIAGMVCGVAAKTSATKASPAKTATVMATMTAWDAVTVTASPPPPNGPKSVIPGDGVYLVVADVLPGQYRATVPVDSSNCYWERMRDTAGSLNSIIANGNEGAGAPIIVTIGGSDAAFRSRGCGSWAKTR